MITLVDSKIAREGFEFINYGSSEECADCRLLKTCAETLEKGRRYRIVALRDIEHECKLHGKVTVVEVEESEIDSAINEKLAFPGAKFEYKSINCKEIFCQNYEYCSSEGLRDGDFCRILEVFERLECKKDKKLVHAKLKRI
jgi:hypothetical protein